jgi:hypothetical protein
MRTRLIRPRPGSEVVEWPRLAGRMAEALRAGRIVGIVAGAAHGKTVAMAQALEAAAAEGMPAAWLALDERVETAQALLAHVLAALGTAVPGLGSSITLDGPTEAALTAVVNETVETLSDPVAPALDDAHARPGGSSDRRPARGGAGDDLVPAGGTGPGASGGRGAHRPAAPGHRAAHRHRGLPAWGPSCRSPTRGRRGWAWP